MLLAQILKLDRRVQVNQQVAMSTFKAFDVGGSITIHAFGAYYGLSASLMLSRRGFLQHSPNAHISWYNPASTPESTLVTKLCVHGSDSFVSILEDCGAFVMRRKHTHYTSVNTKNAGCYTSDLFAMLGTLFLWIYWCAHGILTCRIMLSPLPKCSCPLVSALPTRVSQMQQQLDHARDTTRSVACRCRPSFNGALASYPIKTGALTQLPGLGLEA